MLEERSNHFPTFQHDRQCEVPTQKNVVGVSPHERSVHPETMRVFIVPSRLGSVAQAEVRSVQNVSCFREKQGLGDDCRVTSTDA